jgi:hypothetical protein
MKSRTAGYILEKDQPNIVNSRMYSYIKTSDIPRAEGYLDVKKPYLLVSSRLAFCWKKFNEPRCCG